MSHSHDTTTQHPCPACSFGPFARNHYFTGKLLVERDFTDETRFHMEKLRHHEQQLHGWGVVCGLKVKPHRNEACRDRFVCVEPGSAVDCCGRDIIVREEECFDITQTAAIKALQAKDDKASHRLQICVRFRECPTEEIPVLYDDCGCDDTKCAPNRILESYELDVVVDPPDAPESPKGENSLEACEDILWRHLKDCPHCDTPDCVALATIENYQLGDQIEERTDPSTGPENKVALIDNRTRRLLPSTQALTELVACLLKRGTGGVGPRGPKGDKGDKGPPGPGLDRASIRLVECSEGGSAEIVPVDDQRVLELVVPTSCASDLTHICAINWIHGADFSRTSFHENGLWLAFDKPVKREDLNRDSFIVLAQQQTDQGGPTCWCELPGEITPGKFKEPCSLNTTFESPGGGVNGMKFKPDHGASANLMGKIRVVLKGDLIRDEAGKGLDANHLPPWFTAPPGSEPDYKTGDGVAGGTFESWFTLKDQ